MRVPAVLRALYQGPGGIVVTGVGALALLVSAIALGFAGFGITLFLLLLISFGELWRACLSQEKKLDEASSEVADARVAAEKARRVASENEALKSEVRELAAKTASPDTSYEALLSAINVHLSVLSTVERHRAVRAEAPDARVTGARMAEDGTVALTADCSGGPQPFLEESVVLVQRGRAQQASGISVPEQSSEFEIFVSFEPSSLPESLVEEIQQYGTVVPNGYAVRLAGLVDSFESMSDEDIDGLIKALKDARVKIHAALDMESRDPEGQAGVDSDAEEAVEID